MLPEDERKILEQIKTDPQAFSILFNEYHPKILRYVLRRVGSVEIAEDLVSETFFKSLKSLWRFQWRGIPFSSWLYRIASNEVKKYYRSGKHVSISLEKICEEGVVEPADTFNLVEELKGAEALVQQQTSFLQAQKILQELPLKYQEVLSLRFFENKKLTEIAQILGKKEGTIKSILSRGLASMKKNIEKKNADCNLLNASGL